MFKRYLKGNVLSLKLTFTLSGQPDASDNFFFFILCFCVVLATSPNVERPPGKCYPKT